MDNTKRPLPKGFLRHPVHLAAFGFGSGCSPKAPGTIGTLAAIPFYLLMQDLAWINYLIIVSAAFCIGIWFCQKASDALGVNDHGGIVWDEFVGYWITMFAAPKGWIWVLIGFVLFRVFDIWKPQPISYLDKKIHGGFGIMLDDVVAGIYALVVLHIIVLFSGYLHLAQ